MNLPFPKFVRFTATGLFVLLAQGAVAAPAGTDAEIRSRIAPIGSLRTAESGEQDANEEAAPVEEVPEPDPENATDEPSPENKGSGKKEASADKDEPLEMSADDIMAQMGMKPPDDKKVEPAPKAEKESKPAPAQKDEPVEMSAEDIFAQMHGSAPAEQEEDASADTAPVEETAEVPAAETEKDSDPGQEEPEITGQEGATPEAEKKKAEADDEPVEMSAEDIWKQISGGE